ncbi:MAG: hypothetical protein AAFQ24_07455 [Pseudomonadota bacterium]
MEQGVVATYLPDLRAGLIDPDRGSDLVSFLQLAVRGGKIPAEGDRVEYKLYADTRKGLFAQDVVIV